MATHYVDTDAMQQATHVLRDHRVQLENMVADVRHRIDALMTDAYQVPGGAAVVSMFQQEYQQGCQIMNGGLDGLLSYLERVIQQYNGMGMGSAGAGVPAAGVPAVGGVPPQSLPMDSHGGMTVPLQTVPTPAVVTPTPNLPMDSQAGMHAVATPPTPAVVTPTPNLPMDSQAGMHTVVTPPTPVTPAPLTPPVANPALIVPAGGPPLRPHLA